MQDLTEGADCANTRNEYTAHHVSTALNAPSQDFSILMGVP